MKWLNFGSLKFWLGLFDVRLSLGGGSSGGGGTTKFEYNDEIKPYWVQTLQEASNAAHQPYAQYGNRIAAKDPKQQEASDLMRHYIAEPGQFTYGKGNLALQDTIGDEYLTGDKANTYAEARNAYSGMNNPFFADTLDKNLSGIVSKYREATAPDANAAAVLNGTLGGGDHQRLIAKNEEVLAKQLGDTSSAMYNDQYNRSSGLEESYLSRGSGAFEAERQRQMGAYGMAQNDQNLTMQRYNALMGLGDIDRGYNQQFMDQAYGDWRDARDYSKNQTSWMGGMLSGAQGGLPPSQFSSIQQPGSAAFSNVLGTALAGYGMFRQ